MEPRPVTRNSVAHRPPWRERRTCGERHGPGGRLRTAVLAGAVLCFPAPAAALSETVLTVEGRVRAVTALDLDGDSLRDVVVFSVTGHSRGTRKLVSVFWQDGPRVFADRPDVVWKMEPFIMALDPFVSDDQAGPRAILYSLGPGGVDAHEFHRGAPVSTTRVLEHSLPHLVPADDTIPLVDFAGPWSDAGPDLLVPGFPYPMLFRLQEGSVGEGVLLPVAPTASYRTSRNIAALGASYNFPPPASRSTWEGHKKILFFEHDRITVCDPWHVQLDDPTHGPGIAETSVYPVEILTKAEAVSDRDTVRTRIVDLDGDGRPDLVAVVYRETGVLELSGRILVFRSRRDGSFRRQPDQVLQVDNGLYQFTRILDLDGDGTLELAVPTIRLGLWGYIRFLTSRKVSFSVRTLAMDGEGMYDTGAVTRDVFTLRLSRSFHIPAVVYADFDGDGIQDVALGRGEDRICIHDGVTGLDGRRFTPRPCLCFPANPYDRYGHATLGEDGKEILMRFSTEGDARNQVTLTFVDA